MRSLEILILTGCSSLRKFPEISGDMGKLAKIYLVGSAIEELPSSIGNLSGLSLIKLRKCYELKSLPITLCKLNRLRILDVTDCFSLKKLPDKLESMECLEELLLSGSGLDELPYSSINLLKNLRSFYYSKHYTFKNPNSMGLNLLQSLSNLCLLRILDISSCHLQEEDFPADLRTLSSLEELNLSENSFVHLPAGISQLSMLKILELVGCTELTKLQDLPSSIQVLKANDCKRLHKIIDISTKCEWLYRISLRGCYSLVKDQPSNDYIADMLLQSFLQRRAITNHRFNFIIPGSVIPDWFRPEDISSRWEFKVLELPLNWHNEIMGFAMFCVFTRDPERGHVDITFDIGNNVKAPWDRISVVPEASSEDEHVWIGYISFDFFQSMYEDFHPEDWSRIEGHLVVDFESSTREVVKCGARKVYKRDVERKMTSMMNAYGGPHFFDHGNLKIIEYIQDSIDDEKDEPFRFSSTSVKLFDEFSSRSRKNVWLDS